MKKGFLIIMGAFAFMKLTAQTTVVFRPDSSNSEDVFFDSYYPNSSFAASTEIISEAWTCSGNPCNFRSLIKFDLTVIPVNVTVLNANISFWAHPNQVNGNIALGPTYGSYNLSYLRKVTSSWNINTVTWNTLPTASTINQAILATSTNNYQDYPNIDVTNMVQDMVSNPAANFGFKLQLDIENIYNCLIFCSSEFSDSTKRPKLEVTYITQNTNCITIKPDSTNGIDTYLDNYYPNINYGGSSTEIISEAWTCNGDTCNFRSLMKFDLSPVPVTATVTYATLSLYAHPNQINGYPPFGPIYGTSNTSFLRRVTSPWSENIVTWNTQPTVTTIDQAILPQSVSNFQNYPNIDVTNIVQYMVNNPLLNYGFMIQLQNETFYNCMIFCSSDFADTSKHPELYVCYTNNVSINEPAQVLNYLTVSPNPANENVSIDFSMNLKAEINYSVFDLKGKKIFESKPENVSSGFHHFNLHDEIKNLPGGIYNLRFGAGNSVVNKKIVIIH